MKHKNFISRFDIYRIVDPIFRVHTRLFHLQFTFSRLTRIMGITGSSVSIACAGLLIAIITFLREFLNLGWTSAPIMISIVFCVTLLVFFFYNIANLIREDKEIKKLVGDGFALENMESWAEYTKYVIAAFGTRIKIIKESHDENEQLFKEKKITENEYKHNKELYDEILKHAKKRIEFYRRKNEELRKDGKRSEEEYKEIIHWIEIALK